MLKTVGACLVLASSAGMIWYWRRERMERIRQLMELSRFCSVFAHAMELGCVDVMEVFRRGAANDRTAVKELLLGMEQALFTHRYTKGELAWEQVCSQKKHLLKLTEEQWLLLLELKSAFFGMERRENVRKLRNYASCLEEWAKQEQCAFREKDRVYTPVGLLGGCAVIIMLL